jgi:hypothetical protein
MEPIFKSDLQGMRAAHLEAERLGRVKYFSQKIHEEVVRHATAGSTHIEGFPVNNDIVDEILVKLRQRFPDSKVEVAKKEQFKSIIMVDWT